MVQQCWLVGSSHRHLEDIARNSYITTLKVRAWVTRKVMIGDDLAGTYTGQLLSGERLGGFLKWNGIERGAHIGAMLG